MIKIILVSILITLNCNAQESIIKTDLEKLELKGKIKNIQEFTVDRWNATPTITDEKTFNKNGFLTQEKYSFRGKPSGNINYYYNNNQLDSITKIKLVSYEPYKYETKEYYFYKDNEIQMKAYENGKLNTSYIEKKDNKKNTIYKKGNNYEFKVNTEYFYKYDNSNNLIESTSKSYQENKINNSDNIKYTYKNGLLTKMENTNTTNVKKMTSIIENYFYDKSNNLIGFDKYDNDKLESKETIVYKNNLMMEHHFYNREGTETKKILYKYDINKNIISKVIYNIKFNEVDTKTYKIEFY